LTVEEYEERVEAALAARIGRDLEPLLEDLPPADRPAAPARIRHRREPRSLGAPLVPARLLAVAAVVVLAIATGPWALWLLWPALVFTGGCGFGRRRGHVRADYRADAAPDQPPAMQRLYLAPAVADQPARVHGRVTMGRQHRDRDCAVRGEGNCRCPCSRPATPA